MGEHSGWGRWHPGVRFPSFCAAGVLWTNRRQSGTPLSSQLAAGGRLKVAGMGQAALKLEGMDGTWAPGTEVWGDKVYPGTGKSVMTADRELLCGSLSQMIHLYF